MKTAEKPCRITGLTCGSVEIKLGATGELSMKTESVLQDTDGNVHARADYVGPWPEEIVDLVNKLKDKVEDHLLTIHFMVIKDDKDTGAAAPGEDSKPTGLFGVGLREHSGPEADQL